MGDRYRSQDAILQQLGHRHFSTSYLLWFKNVLNFPITQPRNLRLLGAGKSASRVISLITSSSSSSVPRKSSSSSPNSFQQI